MYAVVMQTNGGGIVELMAVLAVMALGMGLRSMPKQVALWSAGVVLASVLGGIAIYASTPQTETHFQIECDGFWDCMNKMLLP